MLSNLSTEPCLMSKAKWSPARSQLLLVSSVSSFHSRYSPQAWAKSSGSYSILKLFKSPNLKMITKLKLYKCCYIFPMITFSLIILCLIVFNQDIQTPKSGLKNEAQPSF